MRLPEPDFFAAGGSSSASLLEPFAVVDDLGGTLSFFRVLVFVFEVGAGGHSSASRSGVGGPLLSVVCETREEAMTVCETLEVTEIETWRSS